MPLPDAQRIKRDLEELGKACVIAGHRCGKLSQNLPAIMNDMSQAMAAFDTAFKVLRKAMAKVVALDKGVEIEDETEG